MIEDNRPYPQEPQDDWVLELLRRIDALESRLDVVECSPSPWSSDGQSWADYRDLSDD
ncbi:hypothetical protein H6G20_12980 [Desertifilum sp. FACHB-1129]|uniref:hypothetical protein n=1 Tax=Desertifilum TaxID=1185872 RepID=UPI001300CDB2|nr:MULTISPECIES: hypothetical protein [Desertifilum]MBD2312578.1 hypothetical protein [Desertifilum sp. FACHB-1129]MBD2320522.1 hypothetical protein [Desertifilum sp. FACHB-866]MBD2330650.1 hypothetical protein [Desertifilum sp. FACHB-868]MDA0210116.1 hypothetical protein [Cyanobacteria bacterium FC1]